mmetsp:Transcript_28347/g.91417  ORF Transcript_28347/g.91417 Transcript_28347/m.91417 type:complete len:253 (-) Transcript_28347:43-801(-)
MASMSAGSSSSSSCVVGCSCWPSAAMALAFSGSCCCCCCWSGCDGRAVGRATLVSLKRSPVISATTELIWSSVSSSTSSASTWSRASSTISEMRPARSISLAMSSMVFCISGTLTRLFMAFMTSAERAMQPAARTMDACVWSCIDTELSWARLWSTRSRAARVRRISLAMILQASTRPVLPSFRHSSVDFFSAASIVRTSRSIVRISLARSRFHCFRSSRGSFAFRSPTFSSTPFIGASEKSINSFAGRRRD